MATPVRWLAAGWLLAAAILLCCTAAGCASEQERKRREWEKLHKDLRTPDETPRKWELKNKDEG